MQTLIAILALSLLPMPPQSAMDRLNPEKYQRTPIPPGPMTGPGRSWGAMSPEKRRHMLEVQRRTNALAEVQDPEERRRRSEEIRKDSERWGLTIAIRPSAVYPFPRNPFPK